MNPFFLIGDGRESGAWRAFDAVERAYQCGPDSLAYAAELVRAADVLVRLVPTRRDFAAAHDPENIDRAEVSRQQHALDAIYSDVAFLADALARIDQREMPAGFARRAATERQHERTAILIRLERAIAAQLTLIGRLDGYWSEIVSDQEVNP